MAFENWTATAAASGKYAEPMTQIDRGKPYNHTQEFDGDLSADTFTGYVSLGPGSASIVAFTVVVGSYGDGVTPVTFSLSSSDTALASITDGDGDGVNELTYRWFHTPDGGTEQKIGQGIIPLSEI